MLAATYDESSGIITTTVRGLSSVADFDAYMPALTGFMRRSAARHGRWLHLVDASESSVQTKDTAEHVTNEWNEAPRGDGFTAYIVASTLAKMQIDRMRENVDKGYFADRRTACAWLLDQVGAPALASL